MILCLQDLMIIRSSNLTTQSKFLPLSRGGVESSPPICMKHPSHLMSYYPPQGAPGQGGYYPQVQVSFESYWDTLRLTLNVQPPPQAYGGGPGYMPQQQPQTIIVQQEPQKSDDSNCCMACLAGMCCFCCLECTFCRVRVSVVRY
ncbi:hypothetical protein IW261DRAFT_478184 [Armillaria novae-zelandiae]|uniref:Cysteine-rich transmembrane CYSTM domain-containing protein n=1 Tax=Armillaria novae-zelandiae TaxID=153914 RepID=A0AA39P1B4_9AGAR|nr:hypothetical protein IW261DRAFT_478184 [Armillaria novae-zelandiae]